MLLVEIKRRKTGYINKEYVNNNIVIIDDYNNNNNG